MSADPFEDYVGLLSRCVSASERRAKRPRREPYGIDLEEKAADDYERGSAALSEPTWTNRAHIEIEFGSRFRESFRAVDEMIGFSHAINQLLIGGFVAKETFPPEVVQYAVSLLLTRAISTSHEICALLRAGFPHGAMARWRTLYELSVVSRVLAIGNRGTVARYVNHRWVLVAKHEANEPDAQPPSQGLSNAEVKRKAREFIRRYGPGYATTYGWAAEVTRRKLSVSRPEFHHLVQLSDSYKDSQRRYYANRAVHADSAGNLLMIDADGSLHSGLSTTGIRDAAMATVAHLGLVNGALLSVWGRYPTASPKMGVICALNEDLLTSLIEKAADYGAALDYHRGVRS